MTLGFGQPERLFLSATNNANIEEKNSPDSGAFWDLAESPLLHCAEADALAILDCCFASTAAKHIEPLRRTYGQSRSYQLLAASGNQEITPLPGQNSFTSAFCTALEDLLGRAEQAPFTTAMLLDRIHSEQDLSSKARLWDRVERQGSGLLLSPQHSQLSIASDG
ncbi:hypothetical protein HBI95_160560 [Parastagonospora nodorum]|nr:hypothetical protein HBH52_236530 [Parastagonospora nodorum]KAH4046976.1 hypothetical protein HBH49_175710 [Parastagonospora nodorum]KAH4202962.1 hypothetical protein HBI95_160560 [Parastagonospora nodorum]KAH4805660.1 hypothetical protein HBH61_155420 [Parastagonospora nodorum]KAH4980973.1 hypothetical protein HBI76_174260 [Parastagonospora nodorum]